MLSEYEQYLKAATFVCCPMCDEDRCVGRFTCPEISNWIEKKENEDG